MSIKIGIGVVHCKITSGGAIERLRVQGLFDPTSQVVSRQEVVQDIDNGSHYHVLFTPAASSQPELGPRVHVVTVAGRKYLRTDHNDIASDNLGELPDCT